MSVPAVTSYASYCHIKGGRKKVRKRRYQQVREEEKGRATLNHRKVSSP